MQDLGYERPFPDGRERSHSDWPDSDRVERAIEKLKSLHDGDRGFIETVECGGRAIPALRELLFEREPSGLFQARCLAAKALTGLKAYDVLIEFLESPRDVTDPVERVGEDAVINSAARAAAALREPRVFDLLMRLPRPKRRCEISALLRMRRWLSPRANPCRCLSARANPACGSGEARSNS